MVAGGSTLQAGAASVTGVRGFTLTTGTAGPATIDTQDNALTITGDILNGGTSLGVVKIGTGTLTLTGASTFAGLFEATEGTTAVNGSLDSPATVYANALFKGTGTIDVINWAIIKTGIA